jgi:molybdenum cofactor biosynthesis protein B
MSKCVATEFIPTRIAVLTLSSKRTLATDTAGELLVERIHAAGHELAARQILPENIYQIRALLSQWIVDPTITTILTNGGTGITQKDVLPEAIQPLFDKSIEGFGELFRQLSYADIGTSTIQSRAIAGVANGTILFCMPGSPKACTLAWDEIINKQLDSRNGPCNLIGVLPEL